jgi:hypothetical protein
MRRAAVVSLGLAVLVAGCGGNGAQRSATQSAARSVPEGFTVRRVPDQGFSIALPKHWASLDAREALNGGALKRFRKANPALGSQVEALTLGGSPIKLLAVAPNKQGGFLTNLNVLVTDVPAEVSYDEWSSSEVAEIQKVPRVSDLRKSEIQLSSGRALHVTYRAAFDRPSGRFVASVHQYLVKDNGSLYVLTYTTTPKREARLGKTFEQSAQTFRLTG